MDKRHKNYYLLAAAIFVLLVCGLTFYYFFSAFSTPKTTNYIYIDTDDNADSIVAKLTLIARQHSPHGFTTLMRHAKYADHVRTGRYAIKSGEGAFSVLRHLKNGMQEPANLTIPTVRTAERLSAELVKHLILDSTALANTLKNNTLYQKCGYDTTTIACTSTPNTYDVYWNVNINRLLDRMKKESNNSWNADKKAKVQQLELSPNEVITSVSIVDKETANSGEKPMIAGMYYNRLMLRNAEYPNGMPLQADPTIKFAWKDFGLRCTYNELLTIRSPYNTYVNTGLPPGSIRIASIASIESVLNLTHHNHLYMCAKEDSSGIYNFTRTYAEHRVNAAKYTAALSKRGIQ